RLKEEIVEDDGDASTADDERSVVNVSLEDVQLTSQGDGMVNSTPICDLLSTGSVSGVAMGLIDNNPSPGFPLSDEKDLDPNPETIPPDSVSKFMRFDLATIVRLPTTTVNLGFASPPQYFSAPHVITAEWNSMFDEAFHKLLTPLVPPLDPPPEPPDFVVIPLSQLSTSVNTPIGFLPALLPLSNFSGSPISCIIISSNFLSSTSITVLWKHSIEAKLTIHTFFLTLAACTDVVTRICDDDFYGFGASDSSAYVKIEFSPNTFYMFAKMPLRNTFFWSSSLWPYILFIDNVLSNCGIIDGLKLWHYSTTIIGVRIMALPTSIKILGLTFGIGALRVFIVITGTSLDMVSTLDMVYTPMSLGRIAKLLFTYSSFMYCLKNLQVEFYTWVYWKKAP
ncbi:swarming motility protein ybiA, partial [Trifolium medium]|nr:swarming motility protein ybiA [Trifolium medium]